MVEIGIPVWHSKKTLPDALDSLVAQTKKIFIVCLSIDGDGEDYSDLISTYQARGLKFRVITNEHGGPGAARQHILDTTECDYIMFLDSDDMLMPQAVQVLFKAIRQNDSDIIRSGFVKEELNQSDIVMASDIPSVTWTHGKIYKVSYLRDNDIRFLSELKTDEDANFNLIAWNGTENKGQITDITYYWRHNKDSITRILDRQAYFKTTYSYYIIGQVKALKKLYKLRPGVINNVLIVTLPNIYVYYMKAKYYGMSLDLLDNYISSLRQFSWVQDFLNDGRNWLKMFNELKPGELMEDKTLVFYQETFNVWIKRLLQTV